MSLAQSVALVAAGLAVASGASYVSLVHGEFGWRGIAQTRSMDGATSYPPATTDSIEQFASYLNATFGSLPAGERAVRDITASLAPPLAFAARFAGAAADTTDSATEPGAKSALRSMIKPGPAPKTRAAALRTEGGAPGGQDTYQVASYASGSDDGLATALFGLRADIRVPPIKQAATSLVSLESAPFPYEGAKKDSYNDSRVLLHIPKGFDV